MSPSKTKNYASSVRQRLLNYARSSGQDFIFVLRTFAMERLLYRLSRSPYVDNFVLKGAMLFKLWTGDFYRQTRDTDILAFKSETIDSLKAVFQGVSQISFADDGLTCFPGIVNVNEIREEQTLKQTQWQAFVRKTRFVKVEGDFGKTIEIVRSFLLPPIDSIVKTRSFEMTWSAGGPWLDKKQPQNM